MYYTVIIKSGWIGDGWTLDRTFETRLDARARAAYLKHCDPSHDGYTVTVKGHRAPIGRLHTELNVVQFADGTVATLPHDSQEVDFEEVFPSEPLEDA